MMGANEIATAVSIVAVLLSAAGLFYALYRYGVTRQQNAQRKADLEDISKASEVDRSIDALSDDAVDERLRDWERKPMPPRPTHPPDSWS